MLGRGDGGLLVSTMHVKMSTVGVPVVADTVLLTTAKTVYLNIRVINIYVAIHCYIPVYGKYFSA